MRISLSFSFSIEIFDFFHQLQGNLRNIWVLDDNTQYTLAHTHDTGQVKLAAVSS